MRDEEVRQLQAEMSAKRQINPMQSQKDSFSGQRLQQNQHKNQSLSSGHGNRPTTDFLSDEESNCQDDVNQINPRERRLYSREIVMNINVVKSISTGISNVELSNSCPLAF